jgi:hypothetical protein
MKPILAEALPVTSTPSLETALRSWLPLAVLTATVFALTRLPAIAIQFKDSDVHLYARYACEWHTARAQGQSFYQLHRQRVQEEMQRASPDQAAALEEYKQIEYPPLAVAWMALAGGNPDNYAGNYVWLMAVLDVVTLLVVIWLVLRLFPDETPFEKCQRWLVYVICCGPLYGVLYTRLDLGVAMLVTAALGLLVSRRHWVLSLAVLAMAIHFKLMPVVLAPLWLIGTLPLATLQAPWRILAGALAWRTLLLGGLGLLILAPFYSWEGPAVFGFLAYHKDRGIEIETTYCSLLLLLRPFGYDFEVYHSHGSVNVRSALTPYLTAASTVVMALSLLAALAVFVAALWRRQRHQGEHCDSAMTVAQAYPRLVAGSALLLLSISMAANKVFSVQYLVWVLPLAPLVDCRPPVRRLFFVAFVAVSLLSMRIFPDCFVGEIVFVDPTTASFAGPTAHGAMLLIVRNALFLALTAFVASRIWSDTLLLSGRKQPDQGAILPSYPPRPTIRSAV